MSSGENYPLPVRCALFSLQSDTFVSSFWEICSFPPAEVCNGHTCHTTVIVPVCIVTHIIMAENQVCKENWWHNNLDIQWQTSFIPTDNDIQKILVICTVNNFKILTLTKLYGMIKKRNMSRCEKKNIPLTFKWCIFIKNFWWLRTSILSKETLPPFYLLLFAYLLMSHMSYFLSSIYTIMHIATEMRYHTPHKHKITNNMYWSFVVVLLYCAVLPLNSNIVLVLWSSI